MAAGARKHTHNYALLAARARHVELLVFRTLCTHTCGGVVACAGDGVRYKRTHKPCVLLMMKCTNEVGLEFVRTWLTTMTRAAVKRYALVVIYINWNL